MKIRLNLKQAAQIVVLLAGLLFAGIAQAQQPTSGSFSVDNIGHADALVSSQGSTAAHQTRAWVEYGSTTAYGNRTAATSPFISPTGFYSQLVFSLNVQPATTYHAHLVATNTFGTLTTSDVTFTTAAAIPVVTTFSASRRMGQPSSPRSIKEGPRHRAV